MDRLKNWSSILFDSIDESKNTKFEYGKHDCTIWATNIIKQFADLKWEANWSNKREALLRQKQEPMEDQVSKILGPSNPNILNTRRGDLVQKDHGMAAALGVCLGARAAFLTKNKGICYIPLTDCTYSWRI